jgi:hypothetical protein
MNAIDLRAQRSRRRRWRMRNGLMVPTSEAVAEALETIPDDMPWAWAALRVLPAVRGERIQVIEDVELERLGFEPLGAFPTISMPPGIDVTFAIEVDVVQVTVRQQHLDAWRMTVEDVLPAAMANLRRAVGSWRGTAYQDTYEGTVVRLLEGWPQWATSLLVAPDMLTRLFGPADQLFVAPYQCNLISLPVDTDREVAADLVDLFGGLNPRSLLLGMPAFALRGGELQIEDLPGFPDDIDLEGPGGGWP